MAGSGPHVLGRVDQPAVNGLFLISDATGEAEMIDRNTSFMPAIAVTPLTASEFSTTVTLIATDIDAFLCTI